MGLAYAGWPQKQHVFLPSDMVQQELGLAHGAEMARLFRRLNEELENG